MIRAWAIDVVLAFNETINTADLVAMSGLMADGHRFIDSAGSVTDGKASCIAAWSGFFEAFPDYRNHFEAVEEVGADGVVATGRSSCSVDALDGPADWSARSSRTDTRNSDWFRMQQSWPEALIVEMTPTLSAAAPARRSLA